MAVSRLQAVTRGAGRDEPSSALALREARVRAHRAEQVVLAHLLQSTAPVPASEHHLTAQDFSDGIHRSIFEEIEIAYGNAETLDPLLLAQRLPNATVTEDMTALAYCRQLGQQTEGLANWKAFSKMVREFAVMRSLERSWRDLVVGMATPGRTPPHDLLMTAQAEIERGLDRLAEGAESSLQRLDQLALRAMNQIDEAQSDRVPEGGPKRIATGFTELDALTLGMERGDLVVLAARPSMGKTSLAMNIAEHVSMQVRLPVLVFSLEMSGTQLAMRILASNSHVSTSEMLRPGLRDDQWVRITQSVEKASQAPVWIDSASDSTPSHMRRRVQELMRKNGRFGLIVVDYLQLAAAEGSMMREGRASQVGEISRSLKRLAKDSDAPVLALSQLNRALELRPDKRPILSDLRESGSIEQDADGVLFLYRDDAYHSDSADCGVAELIVAKQRNGPIGTVRLGFDREHTRFYNL